MRYVEARIEENDRTEAYRILVSKNLQLAPQGKYLDMNYTDIIQPEKKEDQKSGSEIALDIIKRAGLNFNKGEDGEKNECI